MGFTKRSYDQSRYSSHPVLAAEDLREEHTPTFSLADLDLLVRKVGSKTPPGLPQNPGSFGSRTKGIKWKDAVKWAARAWKTIYIALSARNKPEFFARHPIHGAPAEDFVFEYARHYCEGKAIKLLKFHTTYLFAAHTKNEVPVAPFDLKGGLPGVLGGGWVYKACHRLMRGRTSDLARATDVLYSKYGMPKASEDFVERTLVAHEKALTTSATLADPYTIVVRKTGKDGVETHDLLPATRAAEKAIKRSIQTVADAIFRDHPFHWRHLVPKPSSCFERNTKNGGQITELIEQFTNWDSRSRPFDGSEFLQLDGEYAMFEAKPGEVREYRLSFRKVELVQRFEDFVCVVAEGRLSDWLNARQFGILEPLKCRVILMAQAVEMYLCTALQRWMHGLMKRVPIFRFIGSPDSLEEIQAVFRDGLGPGEEFVSGDYEAATDNLRGEFSSWAWSCIASSAGLLNQNLIELGHKCLTRHKIFPAQSRKVPDVGHEQKNGQSMGSPMSFPVLCLVNAACWLTVFGEGEHPERLLWNGRVRVNGDDIVYAGPRGFYEPWWSVNTVAGLKPSIGKNYRSERFVNINSHTYELTGSHTADGEPVWRSIRSVNTALVQDLVRKGINAGQRTGIPWFSQKANFDYLVKGHRLQTQQNLKSMFLQHVRVPPMIATDLGVVLGGPGFSVGAVSLKARCQTAAALCANRKDFLLRVPRPEDDSWAGRIVQGLLTERTVNTVIAEQEDPLFAPQWRSETRLCSGDLLAALLDGFSESGRHSVDCKNPILNPTADHLEGTSGFTQPEFLRKASRYEARVCSWYTDQMNRLFRPGRPTCLFPSDVETTLRYSRQKGFVVKRTLGLDFLSRHPFGGRWLV